jgi:nicotinate-nucleotide adenylyltransferase
VRLGILGGTFNPPHLGHLICAQEAYLQLDLDEAIFVPARMPPHKSVQEEPGPQHRLALCRAAVAGDERFTVSDLEVGREGPSYTVDTLTELHSRVPDSELFFVVGGDVAAGLPEWREPERVLSLATLAVAGRRGTARATIEDALLRLRAGRQVAFFRMPRIAISSTLVRSRVRSGQSIKYIVPDAVATYIHEHGLYGGPAEI